MGEFKSFYKEVGGGEGEKCHYPTRLDTYGCGCQHDCSYCYAKSLLSFRNLWDSKNPAVASMSEIEKTVRKIPKGTIVRLGGMTDCFQPLELTQRNTYNTIKLLNRYGIGYLIVTKSHIVANDEYMDYDSLNALGIDKAIVEFLRVNTWVRKWFDIDYSDYVLKQGSYRFLRLDKKKEMLAKIHIPSVSICEDYTPHYKYWLVRTIPNRDDCCNLRRYDADE